MKIRTLLSLGAIVALFSLAGCGSGLATEGDTCESGGECDPGLFCFISGGSKSGTCTVNPASCGDVPKCACYEEVKKGCSSSACVSIGGSVTLTCEK